VRAIAIPTPYQEATPSPFGMKKLFRQTLRKRDSAVRSDRDVQNLHGGEAQTSETPTNNSVTPSGPEPDDSRATMLAPNSVTPAANENQTESAERQGKYSALERAERRLNEASAKLESMFPDLGGAQGIELNAIGASSDLNSLLDALGSTVDSLMQERTIEEAKRPGIQALIRTWTKKTLPFISKALNGATVLSLPWPC
jgi:hypothetical protein